MKNIEAKNLVIGIAGGTGSGKTTLAHAVQQQLGDSRSMIVSQDAYYKDRRDVAVEQRMEINYDHPDALDLPLLAEHLRALKSDVNVVVPRYDFTTHTRKHAGVLTSPKPVVIVEGILLFSEPLVRAVCDLMVFVDTADDVRFVRRLTRDMAERGRTAESVVEQYLETVRPMHRQFVSGGEKYADLVISGEAPLDQGVTAVLKIIKKYGATLPDVKPN